MFGFTLPVPSQGMAPEIQEFICAFCISNNQNNLCERKSKVEPNLSYSFFFQFNVQTR